MRTALIVGGTGQIGRPTAGRLARDGWEVTLAARTEPTGDLAAEFRFVRLDRTVPGELEAAIGDGVDLVVDLWPLAVADGHQLVSLAGRIGSVIAASSAAVYCDDQGRSLSSAAGDFPRLPVPISERQRTVAPGDDGYAPRKAAIEQLLLGTPELRATVLRIAAVHGPHTKHAREWYFVQRALDGRPAVVLARRGESRFHTSSVANIAELIALVARRPRSRALNCADPSPPSAVEISRLVGAAMGHDWVEVLLPSGEIGTVGDHPWNVPHPFILDMTEAEIELGYRPVTTYAKAVPETVAWLVEAMRDRPWRDVLTGSPYLETMFDYKAEDELIRRLA